MNNGSFIIHEHVAIIIDCPLGFRGLSMTSIIRFDARPGQVDGPV